MNVALIVDGIIVLVLLELAALWCYRSFTRRGMPLAEAISFLGAGLGLLIALRVLLTNGPLILLGSALFASLLMQLWHVRQRWQ